MYSQYVNCLDEMAAEGMTDDVLSYSGESVEYLSERNSCVIYNAYNFIFRR